MEWREFNDDSQHQPDRYDFYSSFCIKEATAAVIISMVEDTSADNWISFKNLFPMV